jgi:serine/threonine-protein kinase
MTHASDSTSTPTDWVDDGDSLELRPHRVVEGEARWTSGFEHDEHLARALRLRKILLWGGLAWLSFLPTDVTFNLMRDEPHGLTFVVARVLGALPILLLWLRLVRGPTPSHAVLGAAEGAVASIVAGVTAYMAVLSGGLTSPIIAGVLPILVVRAIAIPENWRRGLALAAAPALSFWLVLALGTVLADSAPRLDDSTIATLILHLGMEAVTIILVTVGSHIAWDVRRNLYKARTVGRYELLRPLGRGAMGEVWAAWHQGLRQEVALKILPVDDDLAAVARFEREVAATTSLRHPNNVRVYDFGHTADGFWFYAMELLDGETLAELVAREGPLPIARALALLRQAARALDEAHRYGIVHRDIKPENLFVSAPAGERDIIKVLDFGVASVAVEAGVFAPGPTEPLSLRRSEDEPADEPVDDEIDDPTEPGGKAPLPERVGTPLYVSPEVARGGAADPRSDIYALGCVLYFMLTGRPVFVERDVQALLRAHAEQPPAPASTLLAAPLPDYVEKLVMRCLAKSPDQRYENADALVRAIDLCLRLGDIDRRRGGGETQQPRLRATAEQLEASWAEHSKTETDMTLVASDEAEP